LRHIMLAKLTEAGLVSGGAEVTILVGYRSGRRMCQSSAGGDMSGCTLT